MTESTEAGFTEADLERAIADGWRDAAIEEIRDAIAWGEMSSFGELREKRRRTIATAALQGILASSGSGLAPKVYVERAIALADALMAELVKPKEKPSS